MKIPVAKSLHKLPRADYRKIVPLQGNLKDLTRTNYDKLKKSISDDGLIVPVFLWQQPDGELGIMDAHQRQRLFTQEEAVFVYEDGVPSYEIPYVLIDAKDEKDAKQKLLKISSQYGVVTKEGFDEFAFDLDPEVVEGSTTFDVWMDEEDVEPEIDIERTGKAYETYVNNNIRQITLFYEGNDYEDVLNRLMTVAEFEKLDDNSSVVVRLLEMYEELHPEILGQEEEGTE